jgi:signal transduction histidine kinase
MRERVRALGGVVEIHTGPDGGTIVEARFDGAEIECT